MQVTQCLERAVQTRGKHVGTIYQGRQRTWAELGERVRRAAGGLKALGVAPGDRVAVLALNSDNYLELFFAIAWCGAVVVPLNTRWAVPENVYALKDAEPVALIVDAQFAPQLEALGARYAVAHRLYIGDGAPPAGCIGYEALIERSEPIDNECGIDNELCGIYYTGGTTGNPKGVMLSHKNVVFASVTWIATLHFSENTTYLHSAGFFHLAGASPAMALTMAGGTHVCLPKFDAVAAFEAIQTHRVNYCLFVPTMVNLLINHPRFAEFDLASVRYCEYGASPMPDAVLALAMEKLPTWEFIQGYGMTECAALTVSMPWRYHFDSPHWKSKRLGTGYAAYGSDIRIVDEAGRELPRGETGEIAIRGPQVMLGYWRQPEATAAVLKKGWMISGDAAWMDDDGFVYIVDRVKDMIISGGENIYSREVENAVHQHPAVRECAVIGVPDPQWGESVHAVVVLRDGMTTDAESLIAHCRLLIAGYKCPRSIEFRAELPTSAAGKILKNELRRPHWSQQGKAVH
jgi:long-chain acyl-CoA synthetase